MYSIIKSLVSVVILLVPVSIRAETATVDTIAPMLEHFLVIGQGADNQPKVESDGKVFLTTGERIYFTVELQSPDSVATGNHVIFEIGDTTQQTRAFISTGTGKTTSVRNRSYVIQAGDVGQLVITNLIFLDHAGNSITGTALPMTTNIWVNSTTPSVVIPPEVVVPLVPVVPQKIATTAIRAGQGNGQAISYPGMTRAEKRAQSGFVTVAASQAFMKKINEGQTRQIKTYRNRNGYQVFGGYQIGRIGVEDFKARMEATKHKDSYRERLGTVANKNRYASLMTLDPGDRGSLAGYGKKVGVYDTLRAKAEYQKNKVNQFVRNPRDMSYVAPSRLQKTIKNNDNIVLRHGGKTMKLGKLMDHQETLPLLTRNNKKTVILAQ